MCTNVWNYSVLQTWLNLATTPSSFQRHEVAGSSPGSYCEGPVPVPVPCAAFDASEAGEVEALTGRCGRAAVGVQSSVKCVCGSEHNTGLPAHRGKQAGGLCCGSLIHAFILITVFIFGVIPLFSVLVPEQLSSYFCRVVFLLHSSVSKCGFSEDSQTLVTLWVPHFRFCISAEVSWLWDSDCSKHPFRGNATRHGCRTLRLNGDKSNTPTHPHLTSCWIRSCWRSDNRLMNYPWCAVVALSEQVAPKPISGCHCESQGEEYRLLHMHTIRQWHVLNGMHIMRHGGDRHPLFCSISLMAVTVWRWGDKFVVHQQLVCAV